MKREFLQNLKVGDCALTKEVIDAIMAENGKDIETARSMGNAWEEKYNRAVQAHQQELETLRFQSALEDAVRQSGGRNTKAIAALLDLDTLRESQDLAGTLKNALEEVKKEHDYLFATQTPPLYARGTGARTGETSAANTTLAGALREKYERK